VKTGRPDLAGIPACASLAPSVSLADTEGARARGSLAAKAAALRMRELATEPMTV
jgi:hypothetical protein